VSRDHSEILADLVLKRHLFFQFFTLKHTHYSI